MSLAAQAHSYTQAMSGVGRDAFAIPNVTRAPQAGVAIRLKECVALVFRLIDRQRQRRVLLELDDHLLNDIGVTRGQAIESHKPFWR
jgi:uncharacterized protein YjiS (DUF1127 family)